ncbi:MAG: hypothetical protein LBP50_07910 [Tannerella sp.]|jgi:hypothetical protein|nr:hypothetical protein [Tannerella sp.]
MRRNFGIYGKKQMQSLSSLPVVLLTLFACLFCWGLEYHISANYPFDTSPSPLWNRITAWLPDKRYAYPAGALLLCGMALTLQRANYYLMLFREKTGLPFLLFLLFNSTSFGYIPLRPVSPVFFLLALCMIELFKSYQKEKAFLAPGNAYKAAFWLSVGSLVWIHLLWMLPLFWYGMYLFRVMNLRTFTASLLGVLTMYWIVAGWCVLQHDFTALTNLVHLWTDFDFVPFREYLQPSRLAAPATAFAYTVLLGLTFRFYPVSAGLRTRRFISFLLVSTRYLLPFLFLSETGAADFLCLFFIPVSLLTTYLFSNTPRNLTPYYFLLLVCSLLLLTARYV